MGIELGKFSLSEKERKTMCEIASCFNAPLKFKIRDGNICIKGGARVPSRDLTRFSVYRSVDADGNVSGRVVPIWEDPNPAKTVNMLPFIAMGLPMSMAIANTLHYTSLEGIEMTLYSGRAQVMELKHNTDALNEVKPIYENMLANVRDLSTKHTMDFANEALLSVLNGYDISAESLLSVVNNKDYITIIWMYLLDLLDAVECSDLGRFNKLLAYVNGKKRSRETNQVTNSERASICLSCMWVMSLLKLFDVSIPDVFEFEKMYTTYEKHFLYSVGNDDVGQFIFDDSYDGPLKCTLNNSVVVTRKCRDNQVLFNDIFGTRVSCDMALDCTAYDIGRINAAISKYEYRDKVYKKVEKLSNGSESTQKELQTALQTIQKQSAELDRIRKAQDDLRVRLEDAEKRYQFDVSTKQSRIRQLEEEVNVLKANVSSYYSDEVCDDEEEKVSEKTIGKCVENINQYSVLIVGGETTLIDRLSSYGIKSVRQYSDSARFSTDANIDFFCVYTKAVAHKTVYFVTAHYDTNGRLFYYNGVNIELLIRAIDNYISKWFE